jgi:tRNA dimethylallyltransferase
VTDPKTGTHVIPLVCGPTAVGKTAVGVAIAVQLGAEIVSADARQVYRGMTIGTAKPSADELAAAPHHFVDELDPHEPFSAGRFARAAEARITDMLSRGRVPLVLGGSTLYIDALVRGFSDIPDVGREIRGELNERLNREGAPALFKELQSVDPASAATMDETKSQRIVRALEIFFGTGTPLSEFHAARTPPAFEYSGVVLTRPRPELYARIDARVDRMLADGLVDEVRSVLAAGVDSGCNALRTIGYREVVAHLKGVIPYDEMIRLIQRNSRRYAKRQITWFKRYEMFASLAAESPTEDIVSALRHSA